MQGDHFLNIDCDCHNGKDLHGVEFVMCSQRFVQIICEEAKLNLLMGNKTGQDVSRGVLYP